MTCRESVPGASGPGAEATLDWLQACDPQWLALNNRLHRHRLPWQGICGGQPVTVSWAGVAPVTDATLDVHLTLGSAALLLQLPVTALAALNLSALPLQDLTGLSGALLLEMALLGFIEPLERSTGQPVQVVEAPEIAHSEPFVLHVTLEVTLGDSASTLVALHLSADAAQWLVQWLERHLPPAAHRLDNLAWRLSVEAGEAPLTVAELRSLRPGDVVMLDAWPVDQVRVCLSDRLQARARLEGHTATLIEKPMALTSVKETCMTDSTSESVVDSSLDELLLKLVCQVGSVELSLAQLRDMGVGSVLQLTSHVHDEVDLMVNGRRIGQGQLVKMGDGLGVRLLSLVTP